MMHQLASLSPLAHLAHALPRRLLLWCFDRLYHEFAWSYDLVAAVVSGGYWSGWIVACVPFLRGDQVLELGCGTGYLQRELARRGIAHVGLDASPQMLRGARRRLGSHHRLVRARAPVLPIPTAWASDVVATFPAPYILEAATLREISRMLRPDGQLVIVDGPGRATPADAQYRDALTREGFAVATHHVAVGPTTTLVIVATPERAP